MAIKNTYIRSSKLAQVLQLLTASEYKSFGKWLHSPWCNSNKKLTELYRLLEKKHPLFDAMHLTREYLFKKLYPEKTYDDKWMRNLKSAMVAQAEKFLAHQRLENDKPMAKRLLAKEYLERHRDDWYEKQAGAIIRELEKKETKETEDYLQLALIHEELYYRPGSPQQAHVGHTPLQIAGIYLDTFFSISKWRHITELNERQVFLSEKNNVVEKIKLINSLVENMDIPVIGVYQGRHELSRALTKKNYFQFKEKVFAQFESLPIQDRKLLLFYLINSSVRLWLNGHTNMLPELLDIYKFGLKKGLVVNNGRISARTFSNIVTAANSLSDFNFSNKFIKKYTPCLAPGQQGDGKSWALSHSYFKQENYSACIGLLANYNFQDNYFNSMGRVLLFQCHFEPCLRDGSGYLFFYDYSLAFERFIRRSKIYTEKRKKAYLNLIIYCRKLLLTKNDNTLSKQYLENMLKKINAENNIQAKKWLVNMAVKMKEGLP
ncbi:MAG TPA: hypothetical protein ENJ95_09690 [Bacteroidetes bacterium]|nr:hypothetical protein [Bacteroidota bacterium]